MTPEQQQVWARQRAEAAADLIEIAERDGEAGEVFMNVKRALAGIAETLGAAAASEILILALIQQARSARRYFDASQVFIQAVLVADGNADPAAPVPPGGASVVAFPGGRRF